MYCLKDRDGILRPKAFLVTEENMKYQGKEIKRLLQDGEELVLVEINEVK